MGIFPLVHLNKPRKTAKAVSVQQKMSQVELSVVSVSAGRQVKMAFVNSVAKPPRDVRRRQERFGTTSGSSTAASTAAAAPIKSVLQ